MSPVQGGLPEGELRRTGSASAQREPKVDPGTGGTREYWTWGVALGLCLLFVATWWADGWPVARDAGRLSYATLLNWGGCEVLELRERGAWWRLLSGNLLHGAWWHALLNIWAWVGLAGWAETRLGRAPLLACVVLGGLGSSACAMLFSAAPMVVGFSGSIFAVGGLLLASGGREQMRGFPVRSLAFWLGLTLALGMVWDGISQAGHLGGLLVGAALGLVWRESRTSVRSAYLVVITGFISFLALRSLAGGERPEALEARVWAELGRERLDAAGDLLLEELDRGRPVEPEAANSVSYQFAVEGRRLDDALRLADSALLGLPDDENVLDTRGWVACRIGRPKEGVEFVRLAIEAGADSEEVRGHLSGCEDAAVTGS